MTGGTPDQHANACNVSVESAGDAVSLGCLKSAAQSEQSAALRALMELPSDAEEGVGSRGTAQRRSVAVREARDVGVKASDGREWIRAHPRDLS